MSIDKKESMREGSEDSMELNSPTPEAETGAPQENTAQQKRKGGRKPVGFTLVLTGSPKADECYRSMPLPRNASNGTARPRLHSESAGLSTSSNLRKPSACTRRTFITCRLPTGVLQMNVSC
jgi:hypothetical protein